MTEDEAKTKWCPFAKSRVLDFPINENQRRIAGYVPSGKIEEADSLCLASDCMAWRWAGFRSESGQWVKMTSPGGGPYDASKADGYCGLAGAPQ